MRVSSFSPFSSPWPDPNSPVLSKIDFDVDVPLDELFKWLEVRDTLLGQNLRKQDITTALALAGDCKHPDAVWFTSIFEGKDVSTKEDARKVFLSSQDDARALCFAWCLTDRSGRNVALLRRAAEMGNAFACSTLSCEVFDKNKEEAFRSAQLAAAQHERDGFFLRGLCFHFGIGCEKDFNLAKGNLLIAAELGHIFAADNYGCSLGQFDPVRWLWFSRAALRDFPGSFLDSFAKHVERFYSGSGSASVAFLIGRALKENIDLQKKEIFSRLHSFDSYIGPANQAVSFYSSQIKSARLAVDTWTLVATRLHVIKDLRVYIGKMIWETRFEANYKI